MVRRSVPKKTKDIYDEIYEDPLFEVIIKDDLRKEFLNEPLDIDPIGETYEINFDEPEKPVHQPKAPEEKPKTNVLIEYPPVPESKFRFQNSMAMLTYKTHLDKSKYVEWFTNKIAKPLFIRLAHETGSAEDEEDKYDHTHVIFKLKTAFQTRDQRFFDYESIHPHIKVYKYNKALEDAKKYIAKEDPENSDLLIDDGPNVAEKIWDQKTLQDAVKLCKSASEAMGIIAIYNLKKSAVVIDEEDLPKQKWQKDFIQERKLPPTAAQRRQVTWYVDEIGNTGKTNLARYLLVTEPNSWFIAKDMGTSRDCATIVQNALATGWNGHGIILDLPRTAMNHDRMYAYIEEIKDGLVTSQKYSGKTSVFNKPHLIIFANWKPKCYNLSVDRWDIRYIKRDNKGECYVETYKLTKSDMNPKDACILEDEY